MGRLIWCWSALQRGTRALWLSHSATPPHPPCRCSDNPRAREALRQCLPDLLRNPQFTGCLKDDVTTRRWLAQLLVNVGHLQDAAALGTDVVGPTPPV
jgi:hypothetical protein